MDVVWIIAGTVVILIAIVDALDTLVSNRVRWSGRFWPTDFWLTTLWRGFRRVATNIRSERRRESLLSTFAPFGLVTLVILWLLLLVSGWAMIWFGLRGSIVPEIVTAGDAIYFSGVVFFTVGFGEVVPVTGAARLLVLVQAMIGVVNVALVVGFLPSLYGAYSERERQLLLLDNDDVERITPLHIIETVAADGRLDRLERLFDDWERWCAAVMESHLSYPMLMWFRSQQRGQSWITGIGVVMDAALLSMMIDGPHRPAAASLLRRGTRMLGLLARRVHVDVDPADLVMDPTQIAPVHARFAELGFTMQDFDDGFRDLARVRPQYAGQLEGLIDITLAPRGFWPSGGPVDDDLIAQMDVPVVDVERSSRQRSRR